MPTDLTPNLGLPLPHPENTLEVDVLRLRDALSALDAAISTKAEVVDINAALAALVGSAPVALDSLRELADALNNNPDFAATIASQIAAIQTAIADLQQSLATKADSTSVNTALAVKANTSDVNTALAGKMDKAGGIMAGVIAFHSGQTFPAGKVTGLPGYASALKYQ